MGVTKVTADGPIIYHLPNPDISLLHGGSFIEIRSKKSDMGRTMEMAKRGRRGRQEEQEKGSLLSLFSLPIIPRALSSPFFCLRLITVLLFISPSLFVSAQAWKRPLWRREPWRYVMIVKYMKIVPLKWCTIMVSQTTTLGTPCLYPLQWLPQVCGFFNLPFHFHAWK